MARAKAKAKAKTAKKRAAAKKAPAKRAAPRAARPARQSAANGGGGTLREVELFLYRQAELLDRRQWDDFIALFDQDGIYWMPAAPEQTTGDGVPSIFYEDRDMMRVRMKRVTHPHAWSQAPDWGTNHVVSNVMIEREGANGEVIVRSRFHMMEFRRDVSRHFAGSYLHRLRRTRDGWRIKLQRVDMVNSQGAFDYVIQVWV